MFFGFVCGVGCWEFVVQGLKQFGKVKEKGNKTSFDWKFNFIQAVCFCGERRREE